MNRNTSNYGLRESLRSIFSNGIGNGNTDGDSNSSSYSQHRRAQSQNSKSLKDNSPAADENLGLLSRNRRLSSHSYDPSPDASTKIGKLSVASTKLGRNAADDLLNSPDSGKHDYDWLLTPPGTPVFLSSDYHPSPFTPKTPSLSRSASATKFSRLSVSQSDSSYFPKPGRSSSASRPSSSSQVSSYCSRSSGILNVSSASVSSCIRPSSPISRSPSIARPSTPTSRSSVSRPSTPSRSRPISSSLAEKPPSQSSRPSTPTSRSLISPSLSSNSSRTTTRPSTPTRRSPVTPISPVSGCSATSSRGSSAGRVSTSTSRSSSPSSRRPIQQSVIPPDPPLDTNLIVRTTVPGRTLSAGRSRPGGSVTTKSNGEISSPATPRRPSSPSSRGRLSDIPAKGRANATSLTDDIPELRKTLDLGIRRNSKPTPSSMEGIGIGRTTSKKSSDTNVRQVDSRSGPGGARSLSTTSLFPQSIKASARRGQSLHRSFVSESGAVHGLPMNGYVLENRSHYNGQLTESQQRLYSAKLRRSDIYESTRYDTMLLKEDARNTNWLHSIDDMSDQGSVFDCGFEPLPEPFAI